MTDERLTRIERWIISFSAPLVAAGVMAVAGFLWNLNNSQIDIRNKLQVLADQAYTTQEAKADKRQIERRLDGHETRIDYLEREVLPPSDRGDTQ
mgnify:CR=1 FL=1